MGIDEKKSNVRDRILTAVRRLIAENGFKGTTTRMIAEAAEINEVTLFRHFKTKEKMFMELVEIIIADKGNSFRQIVDASTDVKTMLVNYGLEFYNVLLENKDLIIIGFIEANKRPELRLAIDDKIYAVASLLGKKLETLYKQSKLDNDDFISVALLYVEAVLGAFVINNRLSSSYKRVDIDRLCQVASEYLLNGLENGLTN